MKATITRYIEELVLDQGDRVEIGADDDLLTVGLDSIGFMQLVSFVEDTFTLDIPPEDVTIETFGTVASIAAYLGQRRQQPTQT